jgi:hypothetical protein
MYILTRPPFLVCRAMAYEALGLIEGRLIAGARPGGVKGLNAKPETVVVDDTQQQEESINQVGSILFAFWWGRLTAPRANVPPFP